MFIYIPYVEKNTSKDEFQIETLAFFQLSDQISLEASMFACISTSNQAIRMEFCIVFGYSMP